MKLSVNDEEVKNLEAWEIKVLENVLPSDTLEEDMKRRAHWVWQHKIDRCFDRFMQEWVDRLRADPSVKTIPLDRKAFVEMVTKRPDYKDRQTRDEEELAQKKAKGD